MLDEIITDEALALKDTLKEKRDKSNVSNQDIADASGLSIHTVTNYFSSRSKASSAFTVGKICMALNVSFDRAFGIIPDDSPTEMNQNLTRIASLEQKCRDLEKDLAHKDDIISMKEEAVRQCQIELKRRRPLIYTLLGITALVIIAFIVYLVHFDLTNPAYGIFRG